MTEASTTTETWIERVTAWRASGERAEAFRKRAGSAATTLTRGVTRPTMDAPKPGAQPIAKPTPFGHEYCGVVEEVGADVRDIKRGQFVIGSFCASDNTCPICKAGYQTSCVHRQFLLGAQARYMRVPLADGTLVATPDTPPAALVPSLLAASDVLGTGWFAAHAANVKPGATVAVVGDGAVG